MTKHDALSVAVLIAGLAGANVCVRTDIRRRRLGLNPVLGTIPAVLAGATFLAFSLLHASETGALLMAFVVASAGVLLTGWVAEASTWIIADIAAVSSAALIAIALLIFLFVARMVPRAIAAEFVAAVVLFLFLWSEGRRTMQWQRPDGIVSAEFLVIMGMAGLIYEFIYLHASAAPARSRAAAPLFTLAGLCLLILTLRRYFTSREEHRIVAHIGEWGESLQPEYTPPTPECPFPQRWKMYDTMTAEIEVLDFLKCLVIALKPNLIVETGSFAGISTLAMAQALQENGFGKIVSCEFDKEVFAKAEERIAASGLAKWVELRNESSLEMSVGGTIDLLFSDSDQKIREHEVRKFLPQMNPHGVILIHDASSHYGIVRQSALAMEQEGLISVVLLPTPRGLVIAQKSRN